MKVTVEIEVEVVHPKRNHQMIFRTRVGEAADTDTGEVYGLNYACFGGGAPVVDFPDGADTCVAFTWNEIVNAAVMAAEAVARDRFEEGGDEPCAI